MAAAVGGNALFGFKQGDMVMGFALPEGAPAAASQVQAPPASPTRIITPLAGDRRMPGLFAERIRFLPGDRGRSHVHSGELHVTVVRGRIFLTWGTRFDTTGARALAAGDFVVLPAGRAHFEWVDEPTEIHVQGVGPVATKYLDSLPAAGR